MGKLVSVSVIASVSESGRVSVSASVSESCCTPTVRTPSVSTLFGKNERNQNEVQVSKVV